MAASLSEAQKRALLSSAGATTWTSASSAPSPRAERSASPEIGSATSARTLRPISAVLKLGDAAYAPLRRGVALHGARAGASEAMDRGVQQEASHGDREHDPEDEQHAGAALRVVATRAGIRGEEDGGHEHVDHAFPL